MGSFLSRLRISTKLSLAFGLGAALLACVSLWQVNAVRKDGQEIINLFEKRMVPIRLLKAVSDAYVMDIVGTARLVRSGALDPRAGFGKSQQARVNLSRDWASFRSAHGDATQREALAETEKLMAEVDSQLDYLEVLLYSADMARLGQFVDESLLPVVNAIVALAQDARMLRVSEAKAQAANRAKSAFLSNMSHELRTPLNAIMGFSDIMRQSLFGPMPDKYSEYSALIHESGQHLLELINDVLDMSKIEAERFELHREEFDARDAVSAVMRLMRGQADRAGVNLRGLLPKEHLEVTADRRALKQIALNLISNALKFTPKGGAVTVTAHAEGPMLELIVADTGTGIGAADLQRLGRPYEQAGGADQRAAGTGLGLSLVRAFAELHGGEMAIESQLGEGTTVTVRLPVMEIEPAPVTP